MAAGNVEDMVTYSKSYRELNIPYIFDPGQQISVLSGEQLTDTITGSELLISNDYELEMIMQATDLGKSDLLERTKAIISTFGDKGSLLRTQQDEVEIPAATALQVLDPTGAGDAYRAGLIKGLLMGKELADAARMGATCASYAVERYGTQEHSFTDEGFWARHLATFGEL